MARKLIVCIGIFLSLFSGFMFLDNRDDKELSKQGPGVLKVQQSELDEVETATYVPFGSREYVRIVPQ
ncbi:hypothetical protein DYI25_16445 [Mesobacillus boroniphilus]|jgi:hypothetical protein|uniref:Uncharacterized protein n=1 Tax=Mesobacillus boroniphilus TaxID=308892 RepID=A0A944GXH4_9BACI|nr:hypothetical protein [Mesobacillus boroniphilus]MBS8266018.1 hypothetical protein [Mesobacillus boroniphilus]